MKHAMIVGFLVLVSQVVLAQPKAASDCEKLSAEVAKSTDQDLKLLTRLPERSVTDPAKITSKISANLPEALDKIVFAAPGCAGVRMKLYRALAAEFKNANPHDQSAIKEALKQSLSRPHAPFAIESMVTGAGVKEAAEAGVVKLSAKNKASLDKLLADSKVTISAQSKSFERMEEKFGSATHTSAQIASALRDPANKSISSEYQRLLIDEVKSSSERSQQIQSILATAK